jgi:hypothetical protein
MADIFISYKRQEGPRVEALAQKLRAIGFDVWFDARLASGDSFDEEIAKQIQSARTVLVAWTPGAVESDWVRSEAAMARSAGKLAACYLEPTELVPPFNLIHTEDLADWSGEDDHRGWVRLLAELCVRSGRADLAEWGRLVQADDRRALNRWADTAPGGRCAQAPGSFYRSREASARAPRKAPDVRAGKAAAHLC